MSLPSLLNPVLLKFFRNEGAGINAFTRLSGKQADIYGNGECRKTIAGVIVISTNLNQKLTLNGFPSGDYEEWTLQFIMSYTPLLGRITTCGNKVGFNDYKAVDGPAGVARTGSGVRCALKITSNPEYTWFGQGQWGNTNINNYTELGTRHPTLGFGSSQIYGGGYNMYGAFVLNRPYGSFTVNQFAGVTVVSPPKDEKWLLLGY